MKYLAEDENASLIAAHSQKTPQQSQGSHRQILSIIEPGKHFVHDIASTLLEQIQELEFFPPTSSTDTLLDHQQYKEG